MALILAAIHEQRDRAPHTPQLPSFDHLFSLFLCTLLLGGISIIGFTML